MGFIQFHVHTKRKENYSISQEKKIQAVLTRFFCGYSSPSLDVKFSSCCKGWRKRTKTLIKYAAWKDMLDQSTQEYPETSDYDPLAYTTL